MARYIIAIFLILTGLNTGEAWGVKGPVAIIEENTYDFGEIKEGDIIEHSFTVINKGDNELKIIDVKPDCGCTTPDFVQSIPPGEKGLITLKMDTTGFKGKIVKGSRVITNDPDKDMIVLHMKALIKVPILISREYVVFKGREGEILSKTIEIEAQEDIPLNLNVVDFTLEDQVTFNLEEVEAGKSFILKFQNKAARTGMFSGLLKINTNYPEKPEILIKIRGKFVSNG